MALAGTLETTFSSDGFDLAKTVTSLASVLGDVAVPDAGIDAGGVEAAASRLAQRDLGSIGGAVEGVLSVAGSVGASLPVVDDLLRPVLAAVQTAERLTAADTLDVVGALERAAAQAPGGIGLRGLAAPLRALDEARASPAVDGVVRAVSGLVPGGVDLGAPAGALGGAAGGVVALVQLLGALMAAETLTHDIRAAAELVGGMLDPVQVDAVVGRLDGLVGTALPALIRDADADSDLLAQALAVPVAEVADATRAAADVLVGGMAFGEATLVHADIPRLEAGLDTASALLVESAIAPVGALALQARAALEPVLAVDLGPNAPSLDAFWDEVLAVVDDLAAAIDALDPATFAAPLTSGLAGALAVLDRFGELVTEAVATFRSAFETVRQAIAAVDLRPVADAIRAAFEPIAAALEQVQALVGDAEASIELAKDAVVEGMDDVKAALGGVATATHAAFQGVADAIEALHVDELQATLEGGVQEVAQAVRAAQLTPVFDTAVEVMETTAGIVDAVPLDLLPDDVKAEFESAARPIKQIDFDTAIRVTLVGQLREILDTLDTDVLDEVEAAYADVLRFLHTIDPGDAFEQLERDAFDPMLERVRAVDPTTVLEPVTAVLDELRAAVSSLDLRADVLGPLDGAYKQLEDAFAGLDPAAFVAPLTDRVTALREQITQTLQLDAWAGRLDAVDGFVADVLGRLDFDRVVELLEAAWDGLRPAPGTPSGVSAAGTLLAGLLEGTGLPVRAESFTTVARWIAGDDAPAEARARLAAAADALQAARTAVQRADVGPLVGRLSPYHRALLDAVRGHPEGSALRRRLEPLLAGADPLELLGATLDNRTRYLAALDDALARVGRLATSGRSELGAVAQGLRVALRPLGAVPDKLRSVLARFGLDPTARDLRSMLGAAMDTLRPQRALAPLSTAVAALEAKLRALVSDGVIAPLQAAVADLQTVVGALDVSLLSTELTAIHADVAAELAAMAPSSLLGPTVEAVEGTQQTLLAFDPLGAAKAAVAAMRDAVAEVAASFRPTTIFAPVLDVYDHILEVAGGLDVRHVLEPLLAALADVERQLEEGLGRSADALTKLQAALP
jgi:hypothetical protein